MASSSSTCVIERASGSRQRGLRLEEFAITVSPGIVIALGLTILAVVAIATRVRLKARSASRAQEAGNAEECAVSECGPDGVPLSLYAG